MGSIGSPQSAADIETPIFETQRTLKVVCIGAGASGLLIAYKLQKHFSKLDLRVFEKNSDITGTWFENQYPGVACDLPAHSYTWSFDPKPDWSANYASGAEIRQYFSGFADKQGLRKFIRTEHKVVRAVWAEDRSEWDVDVEDVQKGNVFSVSCHILLNASGILNAWKWPQFPGLLDQYKGQLIHSAAWPKDLDLTGRTVGLIGNGSSGIQLLPAIAPQVAKLNHFIRSPTWISPPIGEEYHEYSDEEKARFATDPEHLLAIRKALENGLNGYFPLFDAVSEIQATTRAYMTSEMKRKLNSEQLSDLLVPRWSVGCRRLTPGPNYLESLTLPNVTVTYGSIARISEHGPVMADGSSHAVDILICATGFDTSFKPRFPLIGRTGADLATAWQDTPQAYLGLAVPGYPNYFMTAGPNSPLGSGAFLRTIEAQVDCMIRMLARFQKENLASLDVRAEPVQELAKWIDAYMPRTVWAEDCRSWYKGSSTDPQKIPGLWPGSGLHYMETLREVRWDDWVVKRQPGVNRWAFLGDGRSTAEARGGDLAFYIRPEDDEPVDPCLEADCAD